MTFNNPWSFLPVGFALTCLIETPILVAGLSPRHSLARKLMLGLWLNAFSYPIVILVFPVILHRYPNWVYITVAEVFAPVSECALFWVAFGSRRELGTRTMWRDFAVICAANMASFLIGEAIFSIF